jgi:hypothetical protein
MWIDSEPEVKEYFLQQNMAQLLATRQVEIIRVPDYKEDFDVIDKNDISLIERIVGSHFMENEKCVRIELAKKTIIVLIPSYHISQLMC